MRGIIVAVSPGGVIGLHGKIPWHYKGDLRRFKRVTLGATVIMGRLTWESIGRPLAQRRNMVVTSRALDVPGVERFADLPAALAAAAAASGDVWVIGGARIYEEAMQHVDVLDVTYVPDRIDDPAAVRLPAIDPAVWEAGADVQHEDEPALRRRVWTRRQRLHAGR
jgi:dihydrofolate reductase